MVCILAWACAGAPRPAADRSAVWGHVRLVPHEGLGHAAPIAGGAGPTYADRRYADAELVDYTRPGFAVVYLEAGGGGGTARLSVREGLTGLRIDPALAAVGVGGDVEVRNESRTARVVTCPAAGLVRWLSPGEAARIPAARSGALEVHVPEAPGATARVFVAPGRFALVAPDGRYEIADVEPGARVLRAWHPRFPPVERGVELAPGRALRVDLEMGVGLDEEEGGLAQ